MSVSLKCYSNVPNLGLQSKTDLKTNLSKLANPNIEKVRIFSEKIPQISSTTLSIFREINSDAPSGLVSCSENVFKYIDEKEKEKESSHHSYKVVIFVTALAATILGPLFIFLEVPVIFTIGLCAAVAYKATNKWSEYVVNKTKAKYASRADLIESIKFSLASDELRFSLAKKLNVHLDQLQLAKKDLAEAKTTWQRCIAYMRTPKDRSSEIKTAISDLEKVRGFYNQFDPVISDNTDLSTPSAESRIVYKKMGIPVPQEITTSEFDKRVLISRKRDVSLAERDIVQNKLGGLLVLALSISLVASGVIASPIGIFGALAFGGLSTYSLYFRAKYTKSDLQEFENYLEEKKQGVARLISKDYAVLKEKLGDKLKVEHLTPRETRILSRAILDLKTIKKSCNSQN